MVIFTSLNQNAVPLVSCMLQPGFLMTTVMYISSFGRLKNLYFSRYELTHEKHNGNKRLS